MSSQHDIGFNTALKKWFVQDFTPNRSVVIGQKHLKDSNIQITDVMCNTTMWGDPQQPQISHGRLTFYDGNQHEIKQTGNLADSYLITGPNKHFKFTKFENTKAILKYDLPNGVWNIDIEGNKYTTKNICGLISGKCFKDHIWFDIEPSTIYFNSYITLINPEL